MYLEVKLSWEIVGNVVGKGKYVLNQLGNFKMDKLIKIHCGNGYTRGKTKQWHYFVASVFEQHLTRTRKLIWVNSGERIGPTRGLKKLRRQVREEAVKQGIRFDLSYGSLHNKEVKGVDCLDYNI